MTTTQAPTPLVERPPARASRFVGIAFLVLVVPAIVLMSLPPYVYEGSTLAEFAAAHEDTTRLNLTSLGAFVVWPLAGVALVITAAHLARAVEAGGSTIAGRVAVVGATWFAVGSTIGAAASSAGAHVAAGSSDGGFPAEPVSGYALEMLSGQVLSASMAGGTVLVVAIGLAARRTHQLPGWFVWTGVVTAPLLAMSFLFFGIPTLVFVLWTATAGILMRSTPGSTR
jgi:hypothetical protein